jgi:transcriptional regulator with XRE-family HTH domain
MAQWPISISHPDRVALRSVAKTGCRQDVSERDDWRLDRPGSGAVVPLVRELDPSAGPLQFLGAELRRARTAAGLSQDQLGQRLGYSGAQVGKVETGERAPAQDFADACDRAFPDAGGLFGRIYQLARRWDGGYPSWFAEWIDSERRATSICWLLAREELPHRLVFVGSVVAVTDLQAEGRVLERLEQLPEVRPWLDELSQRCSPC